MREFRPVMPGFSKLHAVKVFLEQFPEESLYLKVGMEPHYATGPRLFHLKDLGHSV